MKKAILLGVCAILLLSLLTGCGKGGDSEIIIDKSQTKKVSFGEWKDKTFVSRWLGLTFALPDKMSSASAEELKNTFQIGEDSVINEGAELSEEILADEQICYYYDLKLKDGGGTLCCCLYYFDTQKKLGAQLSSANYALNLREALTAKGCELTESERALIAGRDYIRFEASLNQYVKNVYYIGKCEGITVIWITAEYTGQTPSVSEFINGIMSYETSNDKN
ncbi:MAG: hypothetical protein GX061_06655 [Eubacteriaceae bacterium]|nr:hypothetical protein [Eubacteriaceae bacterium]